VACAFNPVNEQGMTIAALGAQTLKEYLHESRDGVFTCLSHRFQKKLAKVNAGPWLLAMEEEF
jgi:hypothetical protein